MHLNTELLFKAYAKSYFRDNLSMLEVGPAGIPSTYQKIINNPTITWHTLDLEQVEVAYDTISILKK